MKVCECGACKWKTDFVREVLQCLKCYAVVPFNKIKKLKDKK